MQFEWDQTKEKTNIAKHRLSFSEACLVSPIPTNSTSWTRSIPMPRSDGL
jgi:uncharacterized DUF497 family protein